jgi:hypothetical protein
MAGEKRKFDAFGSTDTSRLAGRIVYFKTSTGVSYTVNEEEFCATSAMAKQIYQKDRKRVEEQDYRCCKEQLHQGPRPIFFCLNCGVNMHMSCLTAHHKTQDPGKKTCPACNEVWQKRKNLKVTLKPAIDEFTLRTYVYWMRYGVIQVYNPDIPKTDEAHNINYLKMWALGEDMKDKDFQAATMVALYQLVNKGETPHFGAASYDHALRVGGSTRELVTEYIVKHLTASEVVPIQRAVDNETLIKLTELGAGSAPILDLVFWKKYIFDKYHL